MQLCATNGGSNAAAVILSNESNHWTMHHRAGSPGNYLAFGYVNTTTTSDIVGDSMANMPLALTTGGGVGIGTTSPVSKLHVYHPTTNTVATFESGDATSYINIKDNASDTYGVMLRATGNDFGLHTGVASGGTLTQRVAVLGSNGYVGINATDPQTYLEIRGNAPYLTISNMTEDDGGIYFNDYQAGADPNTSSQAAAIKFNSSTNDLAFFNGDANSKRMTIDSSGNIGAPSGTNIHNPSDERLKKNIVSINYGVNTICNLNPVKFNWIDGFSESEKDKDMLGFIAQEVQQVLPEAVENFSNSIIVVEDTAINNPLRVNEKFIIPVLVKSIQELKEEID